MIETLVGKEPLLDSSCTALRTAFLDYVTSRNSSVIENPGQVGDLAGDNCGKATVEHNARTLEDVSEGSYLTAPLISICMPVEICAENLETVINAIGVIRKSAEKLDEPVELVVWANTISELGGSSSEPTASARYEELRSRLQLIENDNLRIRTGLQINTSQQGVMTNIRASFMDAIAVDAVERVFEYEHPVIWLDADTTFLSPHALIEITNKVKTLESFFVHANLQHSVDWANGVPITELDSATVAVLVREVANRIDNRFIGERMYAGDIPIYTDESGLAFALGTYLALGGVSTSLEMSESYSLMMKADFSGPSDYTKVTRGIQKPKKIIRVPSARVGTSARRHYKLALTEGINGLRNPGSNYTPDLGLFVLSKEFNLSPQPVTRDEIELLLEIERPGSPEAEEMAELDKLWFDEEFIHRMARRNAILTRILDTYFDGE